MREASKQPIKSFRDLDVYNASYEAMLVVFSEILPKLPPEEKDDLRLQISKSSKAVPRLIAEGHSKRHQKKGFQKYIDDAMTESNETNVSLCQVRDLYSNRVDASTCEGLVDSYDKISRQLYKFGVAWSRFTEREKHGNRKTQNDSSGATATE